MKMTGGRLGGRICWERLKSLTLAAREEQGPEQPINNEGGARRESLSWYRAAQPGNEGERNKRTICEECRETRIGIL